MLNSGNPQDTSFILKQKAYTLHNVGTINWHQVNYLEALNNHNASLKIREAIRDKQGVAMSLNNLGIIYTELFNYPEALKYYFAALKILEEVGDKGNTAVSFINIGIIYAEQENYPEALKNFFSALKIFESFDDKVNTAYTLNNIVTLYNAQDNHVEALKNYFFDLVVSIVVVFGVLSVLPEFSFIISSIVLPDSKTCSIVLADSLIFSLGSVSFGSFSRNKESP